MQQERRFDLRHVRGGGLPAVERHRRHDHVRNADGQRIGDAASEAETHYADFAARQCVLLQQLGGRDEVLRHLLRVPFALQFPSLIVVARITAQRRQGIRGEGEKPRDP